MLLCVYGGGRGNEWAINVYICDCLCCCVCRLPRLFSFFVAPYADCKGFSKSDRRLRCETRTNVLRSISVEADPGAPFN